MNVFKLWMRAAEPAEQELLAERLRAVLPGSRMSRDYLYQISGGFRQASPELGAAIERETSRMHKASSGRLPRIFRTDLVVACAQCEFAQKCLGAAAVRAEFPVVTPELLASLGPNPSDSEGGGHD